MTTEVLTIDTGSSFSPEVENIFTIMEKAEAEGNEELFQKCMDALLLVEGIEP